MAFLGQVHLLRDLSERYDLGSMAMHLRVRMRHIKQFKHKFPGHSVLYQLTNHDQSQRLVSAPES